MTRRRNLGHPLTQPSPPRGRGLEPISPLPVGEGLSEGLVLERPPTPAAPVLPPEGEDLNLLDLPPPGEAMRSIKGGLFLCSLRSGHFQTAASRVIARRIASKQPRGSSLQVRVSPLGCFAALAMTRRRDLGRPLTHPSPPRGRALEPISPLPQGEGWVRAFL